MADLISVSPRAAGSPTQETADRVFPCRPVTVLGGDCRAALRTLPDQCVHCCITSPPYWGLRDYGLEPVVWGGAADCPHEWLEPHLALNGHGQPDLSANGALAVSGALRAGQAMLPDTCRHCGAWRGQLGLEPISEMYVRHLVEVFREVGRVLRDDGTLWLNLGDTYYGSWGNYAAAHSSSAKAMDKRRKDRYGTFKPPMAASGQLELLKPKDLCGIPWRVALALQADGWFLRCDVIWAKSNSMPESVRDRPTRSHEYLFLLSKRERYYFDAAAIREPCASGPSDLRKMSQGLERMGGKHKHLADRFAKASQYTQIGRKRAVGSPSGRNRRSVWVTGTASCHGAHFATFPPKLIEPCLRASCPVGGMVLDPFLGSGTTARVALELDRRALLVEMNPAYLQLIEQSIRKGSGRQAPERDR